jgi:deazaflavin-dependent oxidoreductase (nitroreductase family)
LLRFPSLLYRANLGWLFGGRFVQLTVRGRRSGLLRPVVLEVIGSHPGTGELLVASGWGRQAQWFRNVMANPRVQVQLGRRQFPGEIVVLGELGAAKALREYARAHRHAYHWFIGPLVLGRRPSATSEEFEALARVLPVLAIRPA